MTPPTRCIAEYHLEGIRMCFKSGKPCDFVRDQEECEIKRLYDINYIMRKQLIDRGTIGN